MTDTPTHRTHILQVNMQQLLQWTEQLQSQRAQIVEKVSRIKANTRIARETQVNNALERTLTRVSRNLSQVEERLNKVADDLNKARGMFLELSDFTLVLDETSHVHGALNADNEESERDRGTVPQSTD